MARPPRARIDCQYTGAEEDHLAAGPVDDGHDLSFGEGGAGGDGDVGEAAISKVMPDYAGVVVAAEGEVVDGGVCVCGD